MPETAPQTHNQIARKAHWDAFKAQYKPYSTEFVSAKRTYVPNPPLSLEEREKLTPADLFEVEVVEINGHTQTNINCLITQLFGGEVHEAYILWESNHRRLERPFPDYDAKVEMQNYVNKYANAFERATGFHVKEVARAFTKLRESLVSPQ